MLSIAWGSNLSKPREPIAALVSERADQWYASDFPYHPPASACVVSHRRRRVSALQRLRLTVGDQERYLVVKEYRNWLQQPPSPRLFALAATEDKAPFEFATLAAIYDYFGRLGDRRFSAIRPLTVLPDQRMIVMEEHRSVSLRSLLGRCHRFTGGRQSLVLKQAFRHTGAWLSRFHQLAPLPHTRTRHSTRDEFLDSVQCAANFLNDVFGYGALLNAAMERVSATARTALPERLPLALCHTDFAPRNVLIDAATSVAVIDTLGRWQAPRYEDVAYFLVALHTAAPQMYSQGWWLSCARLQELEGEFLQGYFESDSTQRQAVRLFEVQALLYRWVAVVHGLRRSAGVQRLLRRCRLPAINRFLANQLQRLMNELRP